MHTGGITEYCRPVYTIFWTRMSSMRRTLIRWVTLWWRSSSKCPTAPADSECVPSLLHPSNFQRSNLSVAYNTRKFNNRLWDAFQTHKHVSLSDVWCPYGWAPESRLLSFSSVLINFGLFRLFRCSWVRLGHATDGRTDTIAQFIMPTGAGI